MQFALAVCGVLAFIAMGLFLPETSHPGTRGIDKVARDSQGSRPAFVWVNPLSSLWLMRSPNLLATVIFYYLLPNMTMLLT